MRAVCRRSCNAIPYHTVRVSQAPVQVRAPGYGPDLLCITLLICLVTKEETSVIVTRLCTASCTQSIWRLHAACQYPCTCNSAVVHHLLLSWAAKAARIIWTTSTFGPSHQSLAATSLRCIRYGTCPARSQRSGDAVVQRSVGCPGTCMSDCIRNSSLYRELGRDTAPGAFTERPSAPWKFIGAGAILAVQQSQV